MVNLGPNKFTIGGAIKFDTANTAYIMAKLKKIYT